MSISAPWRRAVLDVLHHAFVARSVEVVGRMQAVAATDQHQYRDWVRQRGRPGSTDRRPP
jgi:hypothetical protein